MFNKRLIGFSLIMLILIITAGAAFASDNTTQALEENSTQMPVDEGKTFADIQKQIDDAGDNETIELDGEYTGEGKEIEIKKPITISSKNGATINANQKSSIFKISDVNVCIKNINIINSNSTESSAIITDGNITVIGCSFKNNTVSIPYDELGPWDDEYTNLDHSAGAIFSKGNIEIINCDFDNNYAEKEEYEYEYFEYYYADWGGAVYSKGNLVIDRSRFKNDVDAGRNLTIMNSQFNASKVTCRSNTVIENCSFFETEDWNKALDIRSTANISNSNFTRNGGYAIYSEGSADEPCRITISNCNFINNNLKSSGYYDYEADEEFNEELNTIFSEGADLFIYNSRFVNNTLNIFNNWGSTYVENSSFSENSAYSGGAINSYRTTAVNSTFTNNKADFAGAIYASILSLTDCKFSKNNEGAVGAIKSATINGVKYTGSTYFDNSLKKIKLVTVSTGTLKTTPYLSGKNIWAKFIYSETKHPLKYYNVEIKVTKGKKTVAYADRWTNSKGIVYYKASNLKVGTYKITFNYRGGDIPSKTVTVKITKAKTTVKAPKVTNKYKKSKYFKVTVKHKTTKKPVKSTWIKLKIGKKTYKVKTNSKGVAKFNTKKLKVGKYKVKITSGNSNYVISAKSTIKIKR